MVEFKNDILKAIQKAKHKSEYFKKPFSTLCDYLPEYMLNDEKLMEDLEEVFYDWFEHSNERPDDFITSELQKRGRL